MKISASGSDSAVYEEYLEQLRKAKQQADKAVNSDGEKAAAKESAEAKSAASTDASAVSQETSSSVVSIKGTSSAAISDTDTDQELIDKANSGKALTESELTKLKQVSPAVYSRVTKAQKTREELRGQMNENPSNAAQIARIAISQNKPESGETEKLIHNTLVDEYEDFVSKHDQVIISGR
jgi:hypothetical protein